MPPEIATKIDNRYDLLGELGRGGMGVVYKANDTKMDRLVAIKVITAHGRGRDEYQERFLREAKSIAKMQHPNIVVVYDFGYHAGAPYIAMEYVEGVPLDKVIASRVNLTPLTKVDFIVQVCHALHYAHQLGIIHRDVKPGNIMVLEGGRRVKLLDFGIARAGAPSRLSKSGLAMGTTCYMSPEQTQGKKDLDARADIFSAGVVLYELLSGKPPWTGESDYEVMNKIIYEPMPPLAGLSNCPAALSQVFDLALAKDPNARYETAEKMAQALSELEAPLKERALEEALAQFQQGDLLRANDLVSQILRIDTRHREAIELRAKLQQVAQLQQRSEQVRQLRTAAEGAVGQKRYSDALIAVEKAISIDAANTELLHYRELIRNEVKRREDIRKKLELARHAQEMNDLSTAQELVEKALEADPTDTQARVMKSSLEQERKRQQLQEIAEAASRSLAVRTFSQVKESIQQLEALDPDFAGIVSLKKALAEGEAEEKGRIELENLIGEARRMLESGDVLESLAVIEPALARFPAEARLVRLRAQAEALREAAERERALQEQLALAWKLMEKGETAKALASAENAVKQLGADHRLQALVVQLRAVLDRERQIQAEQSILAQANRAMSEADFDFAARILAAAQVDFPNSKSISDALFAAQSATVEQAEAIQREHQARAERAALAQAQAAMNAKNFELAIKILTPVRLDFPNSKAVADALQAAQAANTQKAEIATQHARKREIAEALERALAGESDPDLQVLLAEEAVRRIPGNEAAERSLQRVRQRQAQIASNVERARQFEAAQRYAESIREWENVRTIWPQCPNVDAHIARLKASQSVPAIVPGPAPASSGFSATTIMAAAPATAPTPQAGPAPMDTPPQPPAAQAVAQVEDPIVGNQRVTAGETESGQSTLLDESASSGPSRLLETNWLLEGTRPWPRPLDSLRTVLGSKKLLLGAATALVLVIGILVLFRILHSTSKPAAPSPEVKSSSPLPSEKPAVNPGFVSPPPSPNSNASGKPAGAGEKSIVSANTGKPSPSAGLGEKAKTNEAISKAEEAKAEAARAEAAKAEAEAAAAQARAEEAKAKADAQQARDAQTKAEAEAKTEEQRLKEAQARLEAQKALEAAAAKPATNTVSPVPPSTPAIANTNAPSAGSHPSAFVSARVISKVAPVYPASGASRAMGINTVKVKFTVDKNGRVKNVQALSGPGIFRDAAIDCVKQWRYQPATMDGQPVEQEFTEIIWFHL